MARLVFVLISVAGILFKSCSPYSMGAPDQACKSMTPGHGFDPQDGDPPVKLELSTKGEVLPGGHIDVRLVATDSANAFKGFILQARNPDDGVTPIGNFETEEASFMTCGKGIHNSITHRNSNPKTSVKARWKAPADFEGEVFFRFSTVVEYDKYWVNVNGPKIRVSRNAQSGAAEKEQEEIKISAISSTDVPETTKPAAESPVVFPAEDSDAVEEEPAQRDPITTQPTPSSASSNERSSTGSTSPSTTATTTTTTLRTTTPKKILAISKNHEIFEGCGTSKACFGMPVGCIDDGVCRAVVSYELSRDELLFKMVGKSDGYISVGLSSDNRMGGALTTSCYYNQNNGEVGIQTGFNKGYSNVPLHPPKLGVTDFNGKFEDGFIECQFRRPQKVEIAEDGGKTFKLLEDRYVILLAEGSFRDGRITQHRTKDASSEPQALGIVTKLESKSKIYLKLHGSFMIGSWIFAGSLGILLARYFKQTWTGAKCCKLDQWFVFHRLLMVTTWLLTMAGFILIFIELDLQWTAIPINENPHAVLGCITTGLCFIQPFMALLRCHPTDGKRPIFNWLHWFVGNAAHIIGIVAIFFAVDLAKAELPKETDYLLIAFVAFHFLMHLTLSLMMCVSERQKKKRGKYHPNGNGGYPMHHMGYPTRGMPPVHPYPDYEELKGDSPGSGLRKFFLAVYIIVTTLVAAALIALVVLAPSRSLLIDAGILQ